MGCSGWAPFRDPSLLPCIHPGARPAPTPRPSNQGKHSPPPASCAPVLRPDRTRAGLAQGGSFMERLEPAVCLGLPPTYLSTPYT